MDTSNENAIIEQKMSKERRMSIIIISAVTLIILGLIIFFLSKFVFSGNDKSNKHLELGRKYLVDLDYEQALVEFDKVLEIDARSMEAYLGKLEAYNKLGDTTVLSSFYNDTLSSIKTWDETYRSANKANIATFINEAAFIYPNDLNKQFDLYKEGVTLSCNDGNILLKFEELGFLLANDFYQKGDYKNCLAIQDNMLDVVPRELIDLPLSNCLDTYINELMANGEYDKVNELINKYAKYVTNINMGQYQDLIKSAKAENELMTSVNDIRSQIEASNGYGYSIGQLMPDFTMYDLDGNEVHLSDFLGKPLYINAFTTWCPYCFYEIPDMMSVQNANADDISFIMIDLAETASDARSYAAAYGIDNIPMYTYPEWQLGEYTVEGVPTSFVLNKYGAIVNMTEGMADKEWMEFAVEKALE